jgi:cyclopropane fatty-acyl-phospholipid synthase-like methyltransferase
MHEGLQSFLDYANLKIGSHILDIGCGLGGSCRYLVNAGYKATGVDVLAHYIELAKEITELVGMQDKAQFINASINDLVVSNSFDVVLLIGVLLIIPLDLPAIRAYECLENGGVVYVEDYYFAKKEPLTEEEREFMHDYHKIPFRTKDQFFSMFQRAGFEIEELEEFSVKWSEYAWNRSERILRKHLENPNYNDEEIKIYGTIAPKLLSHMEHYSQEELTAKFPLTCQRIGADYAYKEDKLVGIIRFIAKKP